MLLRKPFDHKVDSWYIGFIMLSFFEEGDFILKLVKDKKKMYKVSFIDKVEKDSELHTTHYILSYKKYNALNTYDPFEANEG